ncbi:MAG: Ig-like domain-containing protein [Anaerolineae bacterium]
MYVGDSAAGDPLCFYEYTLTIDAAQPPVVNDQTFSVAENSADGTSVGTVIATDPDTGDKITYKITAGDPGGVFEINPLTGEITVPNGSLLNFENTPSYTLTVQVTDSSGLTDTATITINVINVNEATTAVDDSDSTDEDTVLNVPANGVLGNDSDPDTGDTLTVSAYDNTSTQGAAVTVNADGSFSYDPTNATALQALAAAGSVDDTFTYTASDGSLTDSATVTITVSGIDDAPIAVDDYDTTPEETAVTISVLANDSDPEGDTISLDSVGAAGHGTAVIVGSDIQYTPALNFAGADSFTYTIIANGKTDSATVYVTVTNQNDPPTDITLSSSSVAENQPSGTPVGNLSTTDPDSGDSFTYSLVAGTGDTDNTSFQISSNHLQTAATFNFEGQSTYSVRIQTLDSGSLTFEKAFTITITDANDPPVAVDDSETTNEDTVLNVPADGVLANDTDEDSDALTVLSADAASAQGATVNVATDGSFTYDPTAVTALQALNVGEDVADTFSYTVRDGGIIFDTATVTVTVTGVNDAPTAQDDTAMTVLETAVDITPLSNDSDPDTTDSISITGYTQGSHGTVTDNGSGTLTYTPAAAYIGSDSFSYTIEDGNGASDTAVVNITVNPEIYYTFLPVALNNFVTAPDLVITSLQGSSDYVEVVIENQGNQATNSGFWVDFYVAPNPAPQAANELWPDLSDEGIAWGVTTAIQPGQVLTLTYSTAPGASNLYYSAADSYFTGSLAAGTPIYAQVDSAHVGHPDGAISEIHELLGGAYNNIFQATAVDNPTGQMQGVTAVPTTDADLPDRQ